MIKKIFGNEKLLSATSILNNSYVAVVKNDDENIPENRIRIDGVRSYRTSFY